METNRFSDLGQATLDNYLKTRRSLIREANDLTVKIASAEPIRTMEDMNRVLAWEHDRGLIMEMIASCSYVIEWLETGRMPGNRRGIERRAGYQREVLTDPARLPAARAVECDGAVSKGTEADRRRLELVLQGLTERERDCYVLAHGECFTFAEIAQLLGISKSSVGTYMTRAQRKVSLIAGGCDVRVG